MMYSLSSLNAYSYPAAISGNHGKIYVPVSPAAVVYAQFDHVSGVAAGSGQQGIPVSKIKILNTLIDQLVTMKTKPAAVSVPAQEEALTDKQLDALIKNYQDQITTAVQVAKSTGYGLAGAAPQSGAIFSLDV